jgi:hypothetical protein
MCKRFQYGILGIGWIRNQLEFIETEFRELEGTDSGGGASFPMLNIEK